jgi:dTDP-4-amino-4,6-dideoxygalactose transaminase
MPSFGSSLSLPIFPELQAEQQQQVIRVLKTLVPEAESIAEERVAA